MSITLVFDQVYIGHQMFGQVINRVRENRTFSFLSRATVFASGLHTPHPIFPVLPPGTRSSEKVGISLMVNLSAWWYDAPYVRMMLFLSMLSNSNLTEWTTFQGVIARVISNSHERDARGRFEITRTINPWIVRHEVQLLINRIYQDVIKTENSYHKVTKCSWKNFAPISEHFSAYFKLNSPNHYNLKDPSNPSCRTWVYVTPSLVKGVDFRSETKANPRHSRLRRAKASMDQRYT